MRLTRATVPRNKPHLAALHPALKSILGDAATSRCELDYCRAYPLLDQALKASSVDAQLFCSDGKVDYL